MSVTAPARDKAYYREYARKNRERLRENHRRWREANPHKLREYRARETPETRAKRLASHRDRKAEQRAALVAYKREQGCVDCGRSDSRLEFDHRVKEDKSFNIPHGLGCSWERLWAEVAKCDVRCSSCHRKRHGPERRGVPKPRKTLGLRLDEREKPG